MRAAIAHRHAEALGRAQDDVGTQLAGRGQQGQRQQVGGDDGEAALLRGRASIAGARVADRAVGAGILDSRAPNTVLAVELGQRVADRPARCPDGGRGCAGRPGSAGGSRRRRRSGRTCLRRTRCAMAMASAAAVASSSSEALASSMPVRSTTICWKLSSGLEPALADLGLVGRVGGVPAGVLQHVAQDHRRGVGAVVAHADQRGGEPVALRHARAGPPAPRPRCAPAAAPAGRSVRIAAGTARSISSSSEPAPTAASIAAELGLARADMAVGEGVAGLGLDPGRAGRHGQAMLSR